MSSQTYLAQHPAGTVPSAAGSGTRAHDAPARWYDSAIALLGRFSVAATFWTSGQTKIEGFKADVIGGEFEWGWPRLAEGAVDLFADEYALPLIDPHAAALLTAAAEHLLPAMLLLGLATRVSAGGLLVMTLVIQVFVYPQAYAVHGLWATILLLILLRGPGRFSLDHWLRRMRTPTSRGNESGRALV
jgi:putative oxidoreductase